MAKNRDLDKVSTHIVIASLVAMACGSPVVPPPAPRVPQESRVATSEAHAEGINVAVPFHVIAHRGASWHAPENTLPAFARAREMGAAEVELDVRMSRDGVLVLFHDSNLERKTNLTGRVADHEAATLLATDIGTWFDASHPDAKQRYAGTTIATLAALFETHGKAFHYHVELKGAQPTLPDATLAMIEKYDLIAHATLTSFSFEQLQRIRELNSDVLVCLLLRDGDASFARMSEPSRASLIASQRERIDYAARAGFTQVGIRAVAMSSEIIEYARTKHGLDVRAWGVGSMADMDYVLAVGANGMTVDWPDLVVARLRELDRDGWDNETENSK